MTQFNLKAFIAHADTASMPTHSHGLVHEPWQQERTDKARDLIAALVPADHQDAAEAALRAKGIIEDDWMPGAGECMHGLDAKTCPCGCFEHEVSIADMEDGAFPGGAEKDLIAELNAQLAEIQQEQEAGLAAKAANRWRWMGAVTGCLVLALALYILA